ncbi:MAG: glycosyltransferase family 39 protein [Propionivibrio sp.]|uniref:ArnT family glycosyltransferase n=1 Tax=Propionivibrio sp. TaxID=2212460 RepID=UPI001A46A034|nr:glycosyltransferase family 39 protein [Propionivibrio sp.]MBL8413558.1 glycosyltransferase family 39 protein [Propionivibrio sp.]
MKDKSSSVQFWLVLICLLSTGIFLIRITGPTDLESYAQEQNVGYLLDLMTQGHWLVQHDLENTMMTRPPLHTWLLALFTALFGLKRLSLALPSFLSLLALGLIVFEAGRRRFGEMAGGLAAIAFVLSPTMAKQVALVGSEPVFTLTVTIAALAAFSAWEQGKDGKKGWLLFCFMAALVTLINGLPSVALATGGLFSYFWEKRSNPDQPAPGGPHLAGIALFLVLTLGWFVAASISQGQALIGTMFYTGLIGDTVSAYRDGWQASDLFKPTFVLLVRYLPFSLPFLIAVWRVFRHPASDPGERRFERFLTCWILFGLLVLSLARQQHADHLLPLWPACALLAGRELARLAERIGKTRFAGIAVVIGAILIGSTYAAVNSTSTSVTTHIKPGEGSDYAREMKLAGEAKLAAEAFIASGLDANRLHHIDTPVTLQLYLGSFRPFIKRTQLEQILAAASTPVDVALGKTGIEELGLAERYPSTRRIFRWPADESFPAVFQVYRISP